MFQVELEFGNVGFYGGRTGVPGKKTLDQGQEQTMNSTHKITASTPGIELGPHWREALIVLIHHCIIPAPLVWCVLIRYTSHIQLTLDFHRHYQNVPPSCAVVN